MHNHNEVQPSNSLPNLSTWHRVPVGAVIPKGVPYAYAYENCVTLRLDGTYVDITVLRDIRYYTEHPVTPPLPTEDGATILVSGDTYPPHILLTREGDRWVDHFGVRWYVDQIRAWAPVTIGEVVLMP